MSPAAAILLLVVVHLFAGRLAFLDAEPRSRWLSAAGGVAVAYIFVLLMPELAAVQETVAALAPFAWLDRHVYLVALAGLAVYYTLEWLVQTHRRAKAGGEEPDASVFWLHIVGFAFYNALIGYVVTDTPERLWLTVAMAVHFMATDHGLRTAHRRLYRRVGRWVVSSGVVVGWVLAETGTVPESAVAVAMAFLGGGVILNVLKEELPEERESSAPAFLAGAAAYTVLLLAV